MTRCFLAVFCVGIVSTCWAQPTVTRVVPGALRAGPNEVVIHGQKLGGPTRVWTSFPGVQVEVADADNKADRAQLNCKVTVPADAAVGFGGLYVSTAAGVAGPFFLPVDDLPSVAETTTNRAPATAQELTLPTAVDGASDGVAFDYFAFQGQAGQAVSIEAVAWRLGSAFDPVVRLYDPAGKMVAFADDDEALGADCRLRVTLPAAGRYVVELFDNKYTAALRYRLRLGNFPLATVPFPLGVQRPGAARMEFVGQATAGIAPLDVKLAEGARGWQPLGARFPNGDSASPVAFMASDLPETSEKEPNDKPDQANAASAPGGWNGRFDVAGDRDQFVFAAKQGQRLTFVPQSRSVGSPSYVMLRLFGSAGNQVAETTVSDAEEWPLAVTIPADGQFRLQVEDLLLRGGAGHGYRIEVRPTPGFSLSLKPDAKAPSRYLAPVGNGAFALDLVCTRATHQGPIELSVTGLDGVRLIDRVIPEKAAAHRVIVVPPASQTPGAFLPLHLVGSATIDGQVVTERVATAGLFRLQLPFVPYPPAWVDGLLPTAVGAETAVAYGLKKDREKYALDRAKGQGQWTIPLERIDKNFKGVVTWSVDQAPVGFTAAIKADKDNYTVTVTAPKDAPAGDHVLRLQGYGEFAAGHGQVTTAELKFELVTPLAISLAPAGPLTAGQKQKVKITLVRQGGDAQPVTLKWKALPPGVTGDAMITIAADKSEAEVELAAAADAAAVKFETLAVEATTKFAGQDLKVDSPAAVLEVVK